MPEVYLSNGAATHNLFWLMQQTFSNLWVVIVYVIACISLCWHLLHGFQSAFRTIGVHNPRYLTLLKAIGIWYSVIISLLFALMPVSMYMGWVGAN
jgi:succinate dehydrogenase / fumarate reductase cytochrome b subunit